MLSKVEKLRKTAKRLRLRITGQHNEAFPLFIFGEMRSGTNMLTDILNRCADVECYGDTDNEAFLNYRLREPPEISNLIGRSYAKVVGFKPTADSQIALNILQSYERPKGIWIYRRYQDVVNSALKLWQEHNRYLYYILHEPETADWRAENLGQKNLQLIERFFRRGISDRSARALIWYVRNSLFFQQQLDSDKRMILVNYERLVQDSAAELKKITRFLGIQGTDRAVAKVFKTSVNKSSFGDIDAEIKELCEEMLVQLELIYSDQWREKSQTPQCQ